MKKAKKIPNPGSEAAQKRGCTCPVMDNNNGRGSDWGPGTFVYTADCPIHALPKKLDVGLPPTFGRVPKAESVCGETRVTDPTTGAAKGSKLARMDLIPAGPEWELAEHYGKGCSAEFKKDPYPPRNWEGGYAWSLSYAAARRHLNAFWRGEDIDAETQSKHVIAAAWHCLALAEFMETHREKDDRPSGEIGCIYGRTEFVPAPEKKAGEGLRGYTYVGPVIPLAVDPKIKAPRE